MTKKYEECPFCQHADRKNKKEKFKVVSISLPTIVYSVLCPCGARGPYSSTKEGAVNLWNMRKGQ